MGSSDEDGCVQFQNDDTWQGGIVERISRHFLKSCSSCDSALQFSLREMAGTVDGVVPSAAAASNGEMTGTAANTAALQLLTNPLAAHRRVMKAFEELANFLRKKSARTIPVPGSSTEFKSPLGMLLTIDTVEPFSPALRYASIYPPVPHPLLGATSGLNASKKASGAVQFDPVDFSTATSIFDFSRK